MAERLLEDDAAGRHPGLGRRLRHRRRHRPHRPPPNPRSSAHPPRRAAATSCAQPARPSWTAPALLLATLEEPEDWYRAWHSGRGDPGPQRAAPGIPLRWSGHDRPHRPAELPGRSGALRPGRLASTRTALLVRRSSGSEVVCGRRRRRPLRLPGPGANAIAAASRRTGTAGQPGSAGQVGDQRRHQQIVTAKAHGSPAA